MALLRIYILYIATCCFYVLLHWKSPKSMFSPHCHDVIQTVWFTFTAPRSDLVTVITELVFPFSSPQSSLFFLYFCLYARGVCCKWQHQFTWTSLACNGRITAPAPHPVPIIRDRGQLTTPWIWLKAFMPIMGNSLSS